MGQEEQGKSSRLYIYIFFFLEEGMKIINWEQVYLYAAD